jgi:hypothetical protein
VYNKSNQGSIMMTTANADKYSINNSKTSIMTMDVRKDFLAMIEKYLKDWV